jgi:hypothetical protein
VGYFIVVYYFGKEFLVCWSVGFLDYGNVYLMGNEGFF